MSSDKTRRSTAACGLARAKNGTMLAKPQAETNFPALLNMTRLLRAFVHRRFVFHSFGNGSRDGNARAVIAHGYLRRIHRDERRVGAHQAIFECDLLDLRGQIRARDLRRSVERAVGKLA